VQLRNAGDQYGLVSKALHWVIALLTLGLIWLGWVLVDLSYYSPWYNTANLAHVGLGMLVLALAAFKLVWMLYSPKPAPQPELSVREQRASKLVHGLLILSMFLLPVTGYFTSTSEGDGVPIFGWFTIPALVPVSDVLRDWSIDIHFYGAYGVLALAVLHAGAAMKHQWLDGHGTLRRML